MDKRKGISLIVLVITILVMIILAGVVIVSLSKNNPIQKANEAKEKTEVYQEKENISLSVVAVIKNKANGLLEKTDDQVFQKKLRENFKTEKIVVGVLQNQEPSIFRITYQESGRNYFVTTTGEISEQVIQKIVLEYKTEDNQHISKALQEYTNSSVKISSLELSEEIKKQNNYIFKNAIVLKSDETSVTLTGSDSVTLDNSILKITMIYTKKEQTKTKYTLTINPEGGTITGSTKIQGEEGSTVIIPNPTEPSGNTVTFIDGSNQSSLKTRYTFNNWMLIGPGELSINSFVFGTGNAELLARYTHDGVVLPDAYKEGYEFRGWYTSLQDGSKVGNSGEIYTPNESQTLYALYEDITKPVINSLVPRPSGITINATDSGSGIVGYACSTLTTVPNASSFIAVSNTKNLSINVSNLLENRLYNVWVKDAAGNISNVASVTTLPKPRYTLTIDTRGGTYPSSTSIAGKEGETISISNPTPPKGPEVTFKSNGGSVSPSYITANNTFTRWSHTGGGSLNQSTYTFGNTNATLTANYNVNSITLPTPTRLGWTNTGWYTSSIGGEKVGNANSTFTPNQNTTLYAQWTDDIKPNIVQYSSTYNSVTFSAEDRGSKIAYYSITESPNTTNYVQVTNITRLDKTINGLKEGTNYYIKVKDAAGNESNVQMVTTKMQTRYTLTLQLNGGSTTESLTYRGVEGETITLPNITPPSGYSVHYNADQGVVRPNLEVSKYVLERWKILSGGSGSAYNNTYTFGTKDTTIQAQWYHQGVTLPMPTRAGYTFKGWYRVYNSTDPNDYAGAAGSIYIPTTHQTLFAKWESQIPTLKPGVNITFTQDINNWTNQNVTVTATTTATSPFRLQLCTGDPLVGGNWEYASSKVVTQNGPVYARLTDGKVNSNYVAHNVTNIDKTPPTRPVHKEGSLFINRDNTQALVRLNLQNIIEEDSGIAKVDVVYKTGGDVYYQTKTMETYPNGVLGTRNNPYKTTMEVVDDFFDLRTIYMYAVITDRAGNSVTSQCASITTTGVTEYLDYIVN